MSLGLDSQKKERVLPEPRGQGHKAKAGAVEEMQPLQKKPLKVEGGRKEMLQVLPPSCPPISCEGLPLAALRQKPGRLKCSLEGSPLPMIIEQGTESSGSEGKLVKDYDTLASFTHSVNIS